MAKKTTPTRWHRILGKLLELLLTPSGIVVQTEVAIMGQSPRADILLLRRTEPMWTTAQRRFLPDGIRDSNAGHTLIEFKYTESVTASGLLKTAAYDLFYRQSQNLSTDDVQTVLVSAKKPQTKTLSQLGFTPALLKGIYDNENPLAARIQLLSLNELADETHNAFIKMFASRRAAKEHAWALLQAVGIDALPDAVSWYMSGLLRQLLPWQGDIEMKTDELTPESIMQLGKEWVQFLLKSLPPEMFLAEMPPEDRMAGLPLEDRLAGLLPEDRMAGLPPEDRLAGLSDEDLAAIEAYLQQRKR